MLGTRLHRRESEDELRAGDYCFNEQHRPRIACGHCGTHFDLPAGITYDAEGRSSCAVHCIRRECGFWDLVTFEDVWT